LWTGGAVLKNIFVLLLILLVFSATSCIPVDISGLVVSSDVDKRFNESTTQLEKANLSIPESNFSFIVITDTHVYQRMNVNLDTLRSKILPEDKFILACGDITQCGSTEDFQSFCNYMNQINLPYYTAIGNHDLYFGGWPNYKQILGRSCYSLTAGPAKIISMDSANGTIGHKQKEWLEGVLRTKTEPLCFVMTHFEFFSPTADSLQQYTDIEEIYYLMHLFETYGVNYVFMGHSHIYNHRQVNNVHYLNLADLVADGHPKEFIRVHVTGSNITYERVPL
jgi:3',5'-cyclic-AMP phosphodiesterase